LLAKGQKQSSFPKDAQDRIFYALHILQNEGLYGKLDIKKLQGAANLFRIRVGAYRILFELSLRMLLKSMQCCHVKMQYKL
jgi:mRNA-degrading endonuclease RelE of RelBE toxin-antitoxin system